MADDNWYLFKRILQVGTLVHILDKGERTPYPIIVESPQATDVIANMKLPEYMPLFVSIPVGAVISYRLTAPLKFQPLLRRTWFGVTWGFTMAMGWWLGLKGSYYKLVGFEDNGLSWRVPQEPTKYKFSQVLETEDFAQLIKRKD
jgi:hypothetical protein